MKTSILKTLSWQLYLIIYLSFYGSNDEIICVSTRWHIVWNPRPVLYRHTDHGPTLNIPLSHESWISNISNLPWLIIKHNTCSFWSHESRAMLLFISSVYSSWQNNSEWCLIGCLQCGTINYWMHDQYLFYRVPMFGLWKELWISDHLWANKQHSRWISVCHGQNKVHRTPRWAESYLHCKFMNLVSG